MSRLILSARLALLALLLAGAVAPVGATYAHPEARLPLDPGPPAASPRSDPAPPEPPDLVGFLVPLDELGMTPALELAAPPPGVVLGLCRRDHDAASPPGYAETRLWAETFPGSPQPQAISTFSCVLAAGSRNTPYGEAHAETGPELRRGRFDRDRGSAGGVEQTVAGGSAPGAMLLDWSIGLDASTLDAGVTVERLVSGSGWVALSAAEAVVALDTGGELPRIVALATNGWAAGTSYRVRIQPALEDSLGRSFGRTESLEWRVPDQAADGSIAPVLFEKRYAVAYDSTTAAATTAAGRFPGGQPMLFQGAWTDPVAGVANHRARWYDSRNASWLSEDPMGPIDSANRYAFVGWGPSMATDPLGLCAGDWTARWLGIGCAEGEDDTGYAGDFGGGAWETVKETGQGVKELGKLIRDEGVGAAVETVVTGTIDAVVEAPENLANWLEFMAEASPEEAARGFGRLAGGAGLMVATGGAGKVVGIGGRAATRAVGAAGRRAGRAVANLAEGIGDRVNLQRRFRQIPCNCFAAGTLVLTDAGLVPIEEIAVGDRVLAYDDATGVEELAEVVGLFQKETEALWLLTVGGETFQVTDEHPIYVADRGWTEVGDLEVGNILVGEGGQRHPVESLERIEQAATVYNFEVAGLHSYFVGEVGVVAHNCVGGVTRGGAFSRWSRTTTPWQRKVYQRADIDWDLVRPKDASMAGRTNLEAAAEGLAPVRLNASTGRGFEDVVLHHANQNPRGAAVEIWRTTHGRVPHKMDPPGPWRKTEVGRRWAKAWNAEQSAYWKWRVKAINPQPKPRLYLPGDPGYTGRY